MQQSLFDFGAVSSLTDDSPAIACGEQPQVVRYKQGTYQGKPDVPPYASAPFNGNQQQWENELRTRTQAQNEYKRIGT